MRRRKAFAGISPCISIPIPHDDISNANKGECCLGKSLTNVARRQSFSVVFTAVIATVGGVGLARLLTVTPHCSASLLFFFCVCFFFLGLVVVGVCFCFG